MSEFVCVCVFILIVGEVTQVCLACTHGYREFLRLFLVDVHQLF